MGSIVEEQPSVVAVVLTWNDTEMTAKCLESLMQSDYENLHVILVDNGSSTPSAACSTCSLPGPPTRLQATLLRGDSPGGEACGRHTAARRPP